MKRLFQITLSVMFFFSVNAQDYETGLGLRGGFGNGVTLKHFIGETVAAEGLLYFNGSGFNITGLYEIHANINDVPGFYWYYGFGAHVGLWNGDSNNVAYTVLGADGILGLEYNISEIPVNIGIDWKPAFNVIGELVFHPAGGALSIRYIIKK